jgi:ligand-binding sensor domain-containing protein
MSGLSRAQWVPCNGPSTESVTALLVTGSNSSSVLYAGTPDGLYLSRDGGTTWQTANSGLTNTGINALVASTANSSPQMLFVGTDGGISVSTDSGSAWLPDDADLVNANTDIQTLAFSDTNSSSPMLFAGTDGNGIYSSTNYGKSWIEASTGLADTDILSLAVSGTNTPTIFAGTDSGMYTSSNNGTMWSPANDELSDAYISAIAVIGSNGPSPIVAAGTYLDGVFLSTNNGASWVESSEGLTDLEVISLAVIDVPSSPALLFAGTDGGGIFLSSDSGKHWNGTANDGLTDGTVYAFAVGGSDANSATLFVGTSGSGCWQRPLLQMLGNNGVAKAPSLSYSINVSPDPCTETATISLTTPESGIAKITIVNILGAPVAQLFWGELDAGMHSFTWNASRMSDHPVAPGTYWCEVSINGTSERVPIVFVK